MDREITEGFDISFEEIGFGYDEVSNLNKIADKVASALYELDGIMKEHDLYEKYPMKDEFGREGTVFDEYDRKLSANVKDAITVKDDNGSVRYCSCISMGQNIAEASLKSMTEVLQETLGKEYSIDFSYTNEYNKGKLMIGEYEYNEDYITESVDEVLKKTEYERE